MKRTTTLRGQVVRRIGVLLSLAIAWQGAFWLYEYATGHHSTQKFAGILEVGGELLRALRAGTLFADTRSSMLVVVPEVIAGSIGGYVLGAWLALWREWRAAISDVIVVGIGISIYTTFLALQLWISIDYGALPHMLLSTFIAFELQLATVFFAGAALMSGEGQVREPVEELVEAQDLGASSWQLFKNHLLYLLVPAGRSAFLSTAKIAFPALIFTEPYLLRTGLGVRVYDGFTNGQGFVQILAYTIMLAVCAGAFILLGQGAIRLFFARAAPHPGGARKKKHRALHPPLEVVGVSHYFGSTSALRGVSLSVNRGEILAILGPSGSGKSTLLNVVLGRVEAPSCGSVLLSGASLGGIAPHERGIAMVRQRAGLYSHMYVRDSIALGALYAGVPREEAYERVGMYARMLHIEHLLDERRPLSGGEQQRVSLARALATHAPVLLLDEPFGSLDVLLARELWTVVRRLLKELGVTAVVVTHNPTEAALLGDRIAIMQEGRIVEVGTLEELRHSSSAFVRSFVQPDPDEIKFYGSAT